MSDRVDLDIIERALGRITPGPWSVWPGPEYVGGGADLCIGAGETWLANMDTARCRKYEHHTGCHDADCRREGDTSICSFSDEITAEQRATADFIVAAPDWLRTLLAEVRELRAKVAVGVAGTGCARCSIAWHGARCIRPSNHAGLHMTDGGFSFSYMECD